METPRLLTCVIAIPVIYDGSFMVYVLEDIPLPPFLCRMLSSVLRPDPFRAPPRCFTKTAFSFSASDNKSSCCGVSFVAFGSWNTVIILD